MEFQSVQRTFPPCGLRPRPSLRPCSCVTGASRGSLHLEQLPYPPSSPSPVGTRAAAQDPRKWRRVTWGQRLEAQEVAQEAFSAWPIRLGDGERCRQGPGPAFCRCWRLPSNRSQLLPKLDQGSQSPTPCLGS